MFIKFLTVPQLTFDTKGKELFIVATYIHCFKPLNF